MALVTLKSPIYWPGNALHMAGNPAISAGSTLDTAGEYLAWIGQATEDMVISHAWVYAAASTGGIITFSIQSVLNGAINGNWAANTHATGVAVTAGTGYPLTLTAPATINDGDMYAIVIALTGGTSMATGQAAAANGMATSNFPHKTTTATGSAVKTALTVPMLAAVGSSATSFYSVKGLWPASSVLAGASFNNGSTAARAAKFIMPFKCRIRGMRHYLGAGVGNFNYGILDNASTPAEVDSSITAFVGVTSGGTSGPDDLIFDNPVIPVVGATYHAMFEPSSATNTYFSAVTLPSSDYRSAMPGGMNFWYASRSGSTWTEDLTTVPTMDLIIDQLDDGVSVGGASDYSPLIGGS